MHRPRRSLVEILRRGAGVAAAVGVVAGLVTFAPGPSNTADAAGSAKITICHRTHSVTNPYRRITVGQPAVQSGRHGGHKAPTTSGWPQVYDSTFSYPSNEKLWGDIIPGASGSQYNGSTSIQLNWTTAGIALFNSAACGALSATEFYNAELAAGQSPQSIIDDLNDQRSNEDAALLAALGGSFTLSSLSTWNTAVSVTTSSATSLTSVGAVLNGSITVGALTTASGFEYSLSPTLATAVTTMAATPASVISATQSISAPITGLAPSTTYYFRATGTTNAGTDTEGVLVGQILSFVTPSGAVSAQTITFPQPTGMTTGAQQTISATATSGLDVTYISNDTAVCTVSGAVVTAVAAGACSLTASQPGNGSWNAADPVTVTFQVVAPAPLARTLSINSGSYNHSGYSALDTGPTLTATPSAGGGTISFSVLGGPCSIVSSSSVQFSGVGTCTIAASITADGTYAVAAATPISFPITAGAPPALTDRTLDIEPTSYNHAGYSIDEPAPTITAAPSAGTGTIAYVSSGPCSIGGSTGAVTFTGTGECIVGATITSDGTWAAATAIDAAFEVRAAAPVPRTLAIDAPSFNPGGYQMGATPPTLTATPSAGAGPSTFQSLTPTICSIDITGAATFITAGTCTLEASITANSTHGAATSPSISFTIATPTPLARTLDIDAASYDHAGYMTDAAAPTIIAVPSAGTGTITYTSQSATVCNIDMTSGAVTFESPGTCTIAAAITADGTHSPATATSIGFAVSSPPTDTTPTTTPTTTPPTTTAPHETTQPTPPVTSRPGTSPVSSASIHGLVWFDRNHNGIFDGREWVLPGVTVTLNAAPPPIGANTLRLNTLAPSTIGSYTVRVNAVPLSTITAITGPDGTYNFTGLVAGSYRVSASALLKGFDYTSDSDGSLDWSVQVDAQANNPGVADFAGLGRGEIVGQMFDTATLEGLSLATITCRWAGFDDIAGTTDDATFDITADATGSFAMTGVPYGAFVCSGADFASGRTSASVAAHVVSPEPVQTRLPVSSPQAPVPAPIPAEPTAFQVGRLPATGSASLLLVELAALTVLAGASVWRFSRFRIARK